MGNSAKRDASAAEHAEQQRKALELRKAGATYEQIAVQLKVSNRSVAWKLVKTAIEDIVREPAEEVLQLELARLDAMLLGVWTDAKGGNTAAIDRALRIMDRRAAYLGLDAPKRSEVTGSDGGPIIYNVTALTHDELLLAAADDPDESGGSEGSGEGGAGTTRKKL